MKFYKLSKEDKKILTKAIQEIDEIFKEFNVTYCNNCISADPKFTIDDVNKSGFIGYDGPRGATSVTKGEGCCSRCATNIGYFGYNSSKANERELKYLKKKYAFDEKYGFFDHVNHCCKLPRLNRSNTCLEFCCIDEISDKVKDVMFIISQIRSKNNMLR